EDLGAGRLVKLLNRAPFRVRVHKGSGDRRLRITPGAWHGILLHPCGVVFQELSARLHVDEASVDDGPLVVVGPNAANEGGPGRTPVQVEREERRAGQYVDLAVRQVHGGRAIVARGRYREAGYGDARGDREGKQLAVVGRHVRDAPGDDSAVLLD